MIKILLAEDHSIVRNGIKMVLESDKELKVIGEASNGDEVLKVLSSGLEPDVILTDFTMPGLDGVALIKELKRNASKARIIILSMYDNNEYIFQSFNEGASGYLLKNINTLEMIFAVKHVHSGYNYLCAELSIKSMHIANSRVSSRSSISVKDMDFSSRELEILHLIADGHTNVQISDRLFLSKRTVEGHRDSLITKARVKNTPTLIKFAVINGLLDI